jgi:osmoprotectant transport system ATP-binding protein
LSIIEFKNVKKTYDRKIVLDNINIEVNPGDFITLIGPSGCGKTTLLKLINGMIKPTEGEVVVYGESISDIDLIELRRKIGYVIQNVALFPHMTIGENIGYTMKLKRASQDEIQKRAKELIQLVNLDESYLEKHPYQLSGGEKQRIGVARALATDPDIVLMDEPFGAVDEINRKILQDELLGIYQKLKKTIIFVTHDIEEAMRLGTTIVLMNEGKIVNSGSRKEILFSDDTYVGNFFNTKDLLSYINITPVSEFMVKSDVISSKTIYMDESISKGLKLLLKYGIEEITVLNHDSKPIGLFSMNQLRKIYY